MANPSPANVSVAAAVLVGPGDHEVRRLVDLADSFGTFETGPAWFVMIDDNPTPRHLDRAVTLPPNVTPVALDHRRTAPRPTFRNGGGLCSGVLMAMQWAQANTDASIALKLDTDSLIIAPFAERLQRLFDADPNLGMTGAYTLTPNGQTRTHDLHGITVRRLLRRPFDWRRPWDLAGRHPAGTHARHVADIIHAAMAHGYDPGEHCLGGGYALPRAAIDRMAKAGHFDDPMAWLDDDLAEDVMLSAMVFAVGMKLSNNVGDGEVFGIRWQGLPDVPEKLLERRYGVIHSVKNDPRIDEPGVRAFFQKHRATVAAARRPDSHPEQGSRATPFAPTHSGE